MATKITVKKREAVEDMLPPVGQNRQTLARFRLQVDRQVKQAFDTAEEAERMGAAIKKAHPIVQVSVYDAEKSEQTILE